ncbi:hypothetical protein BH11BAC5_BH11BAC5_54670 [soil metagenome]
MGDVDMRTTYFSFRWKTNMHFTSLRKTICLTLIFLPILFAFVPAKAQVALKKIPGLPTKEIYDLHVDKKGYLWIAHGMGISRFDGLNFIQFANPLITALAMTDIVEDKQGRIWCHNLTGQIFYIEQGKLNLLASYDYKKENQTPVMVLCGDEILVTSEAGLFICSTVTMKSSYIPIEKIYGAGQISISVLGNKAVILNHSAWYLYQQKSGIRRLRPDNSVQIEKGDEVRLQRTSYLNTIYLTTNPSGTLQTLVLQKDSLYRIGKMEYGDYINSVTVDSKVWVNTRNKSITTDGSEEIGDYNITNVVTGKEGNTWYSSLKEGLVVNFQPSKWKKIKFPIDKEDFVRSLNVSDGYFFAGTQQGSLIVMNSDTSVAQWKYNLFNGFGSIDLIRLLKNHQFIVVTSTNSYIVNPLQKEIGDALPLKSIIDVDFDNNSLYLATSNGFYVLPYIDSLLTLAGWKTSMQQQFPFYQWNKPIDDPYLMSWQRSQAIRFDKNHRSLFVSTKNGLQQVTRQGIKAYLINGKEVYVSSLCYKNSVLYIATINDGLWIKKQNDSLEHFTTANYLFSNTVVRVKVTGDYLWLFENKGMQVFDIKSDRILPIDLPNINDADVFDVAEKDGYAYLTTADGIYKVPLTGTIEKGAPFGYLDYVVVNNKDTLFTESNQLGPDKNDVQFFFSSPAFYRPNSISFKYRLIGDDDHWQTMEPDERMLRFSSLPPGVYTFEALAVTKDGLQQETPIRFHFVILKNWWSQWWFIVLINVFIIAIVFIIIRNKINQRLKVELIRRGIASDLHDDIGATLSSINIYAEMAQEEVGENEHVEQIREHVNDTISRLDDLVWSINPKHDSMEQLLQRMQYTSVLLLEATGVQCLFNYDKKMLDIKLNLADKRNVYLLFNEMVNNVIKHAQCRICHINIDYNRPYLILSVTDDGIGFDTTRGKQGRNGLENMRYRAERMKGNVQINSTPEKGSNIVVQLKVK